MSFERRKVRVGVVVGDKMDKTVVVAVEWRRRYALYRKSVRRRTKFKAHDENNEYRIGDTVRIRETRPLSKTKRWRVVELIQRGEVAEIQPDQIVVDEPGALKAVITAPEDSEAATASQDVAEAPVAALDDGEGALPEPDDAPAVTPDAAAPAAAVSDEVPAVIDVAEEESTQT